MGLPCSRIGFSIQRRNLKATRLDNESHQRFQSPTDVLIRTVQALYLSPQKTVLLSRNPLTILPIQDAELLLKWFNLCLFCNHTTDRSVIEPIMACPI